MIQLTNAVGITIWVRASDVVIVRRSDKYTELHIDGTDYRPLVIENPNQVVEMIQKVRAQS